MKKRILMLLFLLGGSLLALAFWVPPAGPSRDETAPPQAATGPRVPAPFGRDLTFEANLGQAACDVRFQARTAAYHATFSPDQVTLTLAGPRPAGGTATRIGMRFAGARDARIEALDPVVTRSHYYLDPDPSRWVSNVPHYGRIRYTQVYPGIDVEFYGEPDDLEYDFVVAPGARPESIRIDFEGVSDIDIDAQGGLRLETPAGAVLQARPKIYQEVEGVRRPVGGGYVRQGPRSIGFEVASSDPRRPLVIDPTLVFSSYHGLFPGEDWASDIAVDEAGNFYVTGGSDVDGYHAIYVTKFDPDGRIVYWTWAGGGVFFLISSLGVTADAAGNAYVVGTKGMCCGLTLGMDAFVMKLDPSGNWADSRLLRGSLEDKATDITIGPDGTIYIAGDTTSPDFPGANNAFGGVRDAFVTALSPDFTILWSAYVGGSSSETTASLARVDESTLVLVGTTASPDFPIHQERGEPAPQPKYGGGAGDVFIATLHDGTVARSTFWGGSGLDSATDGSLIRGPEPATVVSGWAYSTDFPILHPLRPDVVDTVPRGFLMKLAHLPHKDRVMFSSLLGESAGAVEADASGAVYFSLAGVGKLNPGGQLEYFFQGFGGSAMAVSRTHQIALTGVAGPGMKTLKAHRPYIDYVRPSVIAGNGDGYIVILEDGPNPDATREQDDPEVAYTGTWTTVGSSRLRYSGGSESESDEAGAEAVIRFEGTGIQVLGLRGPRCGNLRYTVFDETTGATAYWYSPLYGNFLQNRLVVTYAIEEEARSLLVSLEGLIPGHSYRLTIKVEGEHNARSQGNWIGIDGFNVLQADLDSDEVPDGRDNCPGVGNPDQANRDGDARGDACDPCPDDPLDDQDWDGICDGTDPCPLNSVNDEDNDGVCGSKDNCPTLFNPDQANRDGDDSGDACDPCPADPFDDRDGDGACSAPDNCPAVYNPDQADLDGDGVGNLCDNCIERANPDQVDGDHDGAGDACDICPSLGNGREADSDADGIGDGCDNCPATPNPVQEDSNRDGAGDACQPVVEVVGIQGDGGSTLEMTLRLKDPDGDPIRGWVRVGTSVTLVDFLADADRCHRPLPPLDFPGEGIAFGRVSGAGFLFDADSVSLELLSQACEDGRQDYSLSPGRCGLEWTPAAYFIDLGPAVFTIPGPICVRDLGRGTAIDFMMLAVQDDRAFLRQSIFDIAFQASTIPEAIDLSALSAGRTYQVEIVATDGKTPEVIDRREFLYRGEASLRLHILSEP